MKVLMISTDRKIFEEGSVVRARMIEYGKLFDELHIIVFSLSLSFPRKRESSEAILDPRFREDDKTRNRLVLSGNVFVYPTNSLNRWFYIFDAVRIGKRLSGNSIITAQDPFEVGVVGCKLAKYFKLPLHIQIHTDFLSVYFSRLSFLNRVRVKIARRILPKATGIRVVSKRLKDELVSKFGISADKVNVLPIFTDIQRIIDTPVGDDLKKKYPQFDSIVFMASRLTPEKNISAALGAFQKVVQEIPKAGLVIVGSGSEEARLRKESDKPGLSESVIFEPWKNGISSYLKTADVFLSTSLYEGYGLSVIEAAAAGLPVVASNVGVAPEIIQNEVSGFLCEPNDVRCFSESLKILLKDKKQAQLFGLKAQELAVKFSGGSRENYLLRMKNDLERCLR